MIIQEIEDYINTYRVYPEEYTGKRDKKLLARMGSEYKHDIQGQTITRLEGRINSNGDFEIIGLFRFPIDKPEEKVEVAPLERIIKYAIVAYNKLVIDLGYSPGKKEHWNLRDMVSEIEYLRSTYYDKSHVNSHLRTENELLFNRHTYRLRAFIRKYKPYIDDMVVTESHNSKYDNLEVDNE